MSDSQPNLTGTQRPSPRELEEAMLSAAGDYTRLVNSGASTQETSQAAAQSSEAFRAYAATAEERAAAMREARERTFDASAAAPGYEPRRYAPTSPASRLTL